jgi:L-alanine-DL-glutamate epimerase-like enolase superfamily enzyme
LRSSSPICASPAALSLKAVIPNFIIHEYHTYALKECNIELCKYDNQPKNGQYTTPDLPPGIGQELNDEVVKDYLWSRY